MFSTFSHALVCASAAQIGAPVISSPAIYDGTVFIGADDGYLYAFR